MPQCDKVTIELHAYEQTDVHTMISFETFTYGFRSFRGYPFRSTEKEIKKERDEQRKEEMNREKKKE